MAEIPFSDVKSSNITGARYLPETKQAHVRFRNGVYEYDDVSPELWERFSATFQTDDSSGKFFHQHIKPKTYRKIS